MLHEPRPQIAGIARILTGVALAGEFIFFMASGLTSETFNDPASALAFLRDRGMYLRLAVLFGAAVVVDLARARGRCAARSVPGWRPSCE